MPGWSATSRSWALSSSRARPRTTRGPRPLADQTGRALGPAVLDLVAELSWDRQQRVEVEVDPRACLLGDLVLDRQVGVVGAAVHRAGGALALRQTPGADLALVVEGGPL